MRYRALLFAVVVMTVAACESSEPRELAEVPPLDLRGVSETAHLANGWLNPKTLELHLESQTPDANDLVIRGIVEGSTFTAIGDIEGTIPETPVRGRLEKAWLDLSARRIFFVKDGTPPTPPFLPGSFEPQTGLFYPSQRELVRGPIELPSSAPSTQPAGI